MSEGALHLLPQPFPRQVSPLPGQGGLAVPGYKVHSQIHDFHRTDWAGRHSCGVEFKRELNKKLRKQSLYTFGDFPFSFNLKVNIVPIRSSELFLSQQKIRRRWVNHNDDRADKKTTIRWHNCCRATNQMYQKWFEYVKNPNIKYILKFFIPWFTIDSSKPHSYLTMTLTGRVTVKESWNQLEKIFVRNCKYWGVTLAH